MPKFRIKPSIKKIPLANVPSFDPLSIPNCVLWLDAQDASTVILNGGNVSEWQDKSGNGQHRQQATVVKQPPYVTSSPINGKPAIQFAPAAAAADDPVLGSNSSTINSRADITTFTVFRYVAQSNYGCLFTLARSAADGQGSPYLGLQTSLDNRLIAHNATLTLTGAITLSTGTGIIGSNNAAMYRRTGGTNGNGGTVNLESRGAVNATGSGTQVWTSFMGSNYYIGRLADTTSATTRTMNGYIGEHLCYQRALTTLEQEDIWAYLIAKWSL